MYFPANEQVIKNISIHNKYTLHAHKYSNPLVKFPTSLKRHSSISTINANRSKYYVKTINWNYEILTSRKRKLATNFSLLTPLGRHTTQQWRNPHKMCQVQDHVFFSLKNEKKIAGGALKEQWIFPQSATNENSTFVSRREGKFVHTFPLAITEENVCEVAPVTGGTGKPTQR